MANREFDPKTDGFYGVYYPCPTKTDKALICMLGDSSSDALAKSGAKWLHKHKASVLCMSPGENDYGHHNYPLERLGAGVEWLLSQGFAKVGVAGASTTGMLALLAAAYFPEISLTLAFSPSDFVMGGFYRGERDGCKEWPAEGESSVSWQGEPLPYLPYCYKHPDYWHALQAEAKARGDAVASRSMFDRSEELHPLQEEELIPVERIRGKLMLVGAEDDSLWDTVRYIKRMSERLDRLDHECEVECATYKLGTHFVFPESLVRAVLPIGGSLAIGRMFKSARDNSRECRKTREDIDRRVIKALSEW